MTYSIVGNLDEVEPTESFSAALTAARTLVEDGNSTATVRDHRERWQAEARRDEHGRVTVVLAQGTGRRP